MSSDSKRVNVEDVVQSLNEELKGTPLGAVMTGAPAPAARQQVTMTGGKVSRTYRPAPYESVTFDMEIVVPETTVDDRQAVCGIYAQTLAAIDEAFRRNFQATKQ